LFTGIIPHSDAPKYLAACDILVSPHLGFESKGKFFGSPTKLFEYMAMGKAIVASRLEQIGEIIIDGVNGLLHTPGSAEELAEKILLLTRDASLRKRLGSKAHADVTAQYTWDINIQRILNSLQEHPSHAEKN
jgi:glycosyltransferase involved in cell wall biosynthesis